MKIDRGREQKKRAARGGEMKREGDTEKEGASFKRKRHKLVLLEAISERRKQMS